MKRKLILLPLILAMLIAFPPKAEAAGVRVYAGGREINGSFIYNDNSMIPLRSFCETIEPNCRVTWNQKTRTASVSAPGLTLTAACGSEYITANGRYIYVGKNSFITPQGNFVLPARALAKALNCSVSWSDSSRSATLTPLGGRIKSGSEYYSDDDVYWLSRIISAEAQGESLLGKIAVGNVVLNRVASREYPDTIYGVIFDRNYGVQFTPVANGTVYDPPVSDAVIAAKLALDGADVVGDCKYFLNPRIATSFWITKNCEFYSTIGNHDFYM